MSRIGGPTPPPGPEHDGVEPRIGEPCRKLLRAIDRADHDGEIARRVDGERVARAGDGDEPCPGPQRAARRKPRRAGVRHAAGHHHGVAARIFVAVRLRHRKAIAPRAPAR